MGAWVYGCMGACMYTSMCPCVRACVQACRGALPPHPREATRACVCCNGHRRALAATRTPHCMHVCACVCMCVHVCQQGSAVRFSTLRMYFVHACLRVHINEDSPHLVSRMARGSMQGKYRTRVTFRPQTLRRVMNSIHVYTHYVHVFPHVYTHVSTHVYAHVCA